MTTNDYRSHKMVRKPKSGQIYPERSSHPSNITNNINPQSRETLNQRFDRNTFVSDEASEPGMNRDYLFNRDTLQSEIEQSNLGGSSRQDYQSKRNTRQVDTRKSQNPMASIREEDEIKHQQERVSLDGDSFHQLDEMEKYRGSQHNRVYNQANVSIVLYSITQGVPTATA